MTGQTVSSMLRSAYLRHCEGGARTLYPSKCQKFSSHRISFATLYDAPPGTTMCGRPKRMYDMRRAELSSGTHGAMLLSAQSYPLERPELSFGESIGSTTL